jgi:ferredoxin
MRVDVDRSRCEGYGVCVQSAPGIFALDDDGESVVLTPEAGPELEPGAVLAEKSCPMQAVRIS